ncbi:MAG TPA: Gfo/Idh/MocA family oxidoreductase [Oscillatoriales cyanobacterium M59_W2019_021]|nr:Gfo/Idh/MocA family oxidoreductase [Oscillatoriales cyanobacterium M4454_W2019_049]HIK53064.1 Gfo/Idh/MocA family oxidoreductase [Oscillatoriales cyanobacterium M59_W2019_021]
MTKIAIIGAGRWGVHLIRNFLEHPEAEVVAVVDGNPQRLTALSDRFALEEKIVLASDWSSVRELPQLDAVVVATPASTHYSIVREALERGWHVLAEKPLTVLPEESIELYRLAERQQRQLVVDLTYLFHPAVRRGGELVRDGKLGNARYGYASRTHIEPVRQDVDALWDLAIHDIAIFNHWLGETPHRVCARGTAWLQPGLSDLVWVTLTYPSGFEAIVHLCWCNPDKQRRLAVVGDRGTLIFDELAASQLTLQRGRVEPRDGGWKPADVGNEAIALNSTEPLKAVCHHFLDCVQHQHPSSMSSGQTNVDLVRILAALTESLHRHGEVVPVETSAIG